MATLNPGVTPTSFEVLTDITQSYFSAFFSFISLYYIELFYRCLAKNVFLPPMTCMIVHQGEPIPTNLFECSCHPELPQFQNNELNVS